MRAFARLLILSSVLALPATAAQAATVVKIEMPTSPDIVKLTGGIFNNQSVYMGPVVLTLSDNKKLIAYCVDLFNTITTGNQNPAIVYSEATLDTFLSAQSTTTRDRIAGLLGIGFSLPLGPDMNPIQGGLWEKLGGVVTTTNVAVQELVDAYATSPVVDDTSRYRVLFNGNKQAFAYQVAAIPEPATWAMMIGGFGLAGAAVRRRRITFSSVTC